MKSCFTTTGRVVLKCRFEQTEIYTQHTLNCDVRCDHQSRRNSWRDEWRPSCADVTLTQNWSSPWNTLNCRVSHLGCIYSLCWIQNSAVISCQLVDSSPPIKGQLASNKRFIVHTDESIIGAHSSQREPCYTGVNESVGTKRPKRLYNLNLELWSALLTEGWTPPPLCHSVRTITDDGERII